MKEQNTETESWNREPLRPPDCLWSEDKAEAPSSENEQKETQALARGSKACKAQGHSAMCQQEKEGGHWATDTDSELPVEQSM